MTVEETFVWPPAWLHREVVSWLPPDWHDRIQRVIALINGKGGVGKTSVSANMAGMAAMNGQRVLLIDINAQGNIGRDLGYRGTDIDDQGEGFYEALRKGTPLQPVRNVRSNLDVVPGGKALKDLTTLITSRIGEYGDGANLVLARSLVPIAHNYDLIFIDSPPENPILERMILTACRWILIPTKSDAGSTDGMGLVAERFDKARALNPDVELLAVLLFATGRLSNGIRRSVQQEVETALKRVAPLFTSVIGHAETVAVDARQKGKLVFELEADRLNRMRDPERKERRRTTVEQLSDDYDAVFTEFIELLAAREAEASEEGANA